MLQPEQLLTRCDAYNPPLTDSELARLLSEFQNDVPESLIHVLKIANGFQLTDENGIVFFGSEDLYLENQNWGILEFAPKHILIATSGGSEYAFICKRDGTIKSGDYGALTDEWLKPFAPSLEDWLLSGHYFPREPAPQISAVESVVVFIERSPPGGLKDLLAISRAFEEFTSVLQVKAISDKAPAVLTKPTSYIRACKRIQKLGSVGQVLSIRRASDLSMVLPLTEWK